MSMTFTITSEVGVGAKDADEVLKLWRERFEQNTPELIESVRAEKGVDLSDEELICAVISRFTGVECTAFQPAMNFPSDWQQD